MNERVFNQEEKIKRAEEIYYKRKNLGGRKEEQTTLNLGTKKDYKLFKKMTYQILACFFIYLAFLAIQNSNYIFSEQVINKTKEVLSYDINLEEVKNMAIDQFNKFKAIIPVVEQNQENESEIKEQDDENKQGEEKTNEEMQSLLERNVNTDTSEDVLYKEEASSVSQVEEDADYIKTNFSFIKPLERSYNIKIWSKKSNNTNGTKVSYRHRYCSKYRNSYCCCNGRKCNAGIFSRRLWKTYKN